MRLHYLFLLTVSTILLLSGCTAIKLLTQSKLQAPELNYVNHEVGRPSTTSTTVNLNFQAKNKNKIGLNNIFVDYEFYTEGKRFLQGKRIELTLKPSASSTIKIPAKVVYKDIIKAVGPVAKKIIARAEHLNVLVKVRLYGNPKVYNKVESGSLFEFSITKEQMIKVPVPHKQINKAVNKAKQKLRNLF